MMVEGSASPSWSDLPIEILELVASRLPLSAHPHFALVCKQWMCCSSLVYPADHLLLVYCRNPTENKYHYYSPYLNKIFTTSDIRPHGVIRFRSAKHGWLLFSRNSIDIFLINPLSGASHDIPSLPVPYAFHGMAFSVPPLSSDFMIFAIKCHDMVSVDISLYRGGNWSPVMNYFNNYEFLLSNSNPVFCGGLFYCSGTCGELGVFNPSQDAWTILDEPEPVHSIFEQEEEARYLMELGGELCMVEFGHHYSPINVFRLNQNDGIWEVIHNLGNCMLAVGWPTSLLTISPASRMENKIYLRRSCGDLETVDAQVKCSEGRLCFVSKRPFACKLIGQKKVDNSQPCSSSLDSDDESFNSQGSKDYVYSIWYDPKIDD